MPATTKGRLTPASIAKLITTARSAPGFTRHAIGDTDQPGLFLIVGRRTASWTLKFRPRGLNPDGSRPPPSAYVIGDAALISVDDARAEAAALRAKIAMGAHPTHEKAAKRALTAHGRDAAQSEAQRRAGMIAAILDPGAINNAMALDFSTLADATLSQCVVAFDLHGSKGNPKTRADTKAHLTRALEEMVVAAETKAADLKQSRVAGLARLHADRPATGRHRVGSLNRLYKWLASVEAATANPVVNIALPSPPAPRTRVITAGQVKALWEAAANLSEPRRDYLQLLLLLPLRRQELADTRRKDIHVNGDRLELVIASHRSKNRLEHRLPLVAEAREIVERLLADPGGPDDFLLKLSEDGSPMNSWRRFQEAIERASGVTFGFHDPRRLFATESGEHDLADFSLIDAALNHAAAVSKTGAARAYHHARHANARANLMTAWAALIHHAVVSGRWPREEPHAGNVVAFNFGKRQMTNDLAPIDDEFVTAFRRLLARARTWCSTRESQNDVDLVNDEAAGIVGDLRDLVISAGLAEPLHHRFRVEAMDEEANPDWPNEAVEARRTLLGAVRVLMEFGPALIPGPHSMALVADWYAMANGDPPLIGSRIPAPNRRSARPMIGDMLKAQIVRLSYYNAGLKATDWETEMGLIYSAGSGTFRQWKLLIGPDERRNCKRVGVLKRSGLPLTTADVRIAAQATRYSAADLRSMLKSLP